MYSFLSFTSVIAGSVVILMALYHHFKQLSWCATRVDTKATVIHTLYERFTFMSVKWTYDYVRR